LPFEDPNTGNLYKKILNGDYHIPKFIGTECREMITSILNTKPEERLKMPEVKRHPWFNLVEVQKAVGGIFVGLTAIPINNTVLTEALSYNFKKEYMVKCIN
jgi:5'-AMP-activated protein kinase catalytic alpha subunit